MPMFALFSRSYPEVKLHIMVSDTDVSLAWREADLVIRLTSAPTETLMGKRVVRMAPTILVLVVHPFTRSLCGIAHRVPGVLRVP